MDRATFLKKFGASLVGISFMGLESCSKSAKSYLGPSTGKVIDAHLHVDKESIKRCIQVMDENQIHYGVNMGVTGDDTFYSFMEAVNPYKHRIGAMYAFDWELIQTDRKFFDKAPDMLEKAVKGGALGLKCFKNLGLTVKDRDGSLLRIDDPRLFPVWERAEKLNVIVSFHSTDPVAFFAPWNAQNERWQELELHPEWSFADRTKYPPRDQILEQRDNVILKFPNLKFQGCHVGNNAEDLDMVDKRLDAMPNFFLDISARVGELGRHPAEKGHALFTKHQDRLMFGTDHQYRKNGEVLGAGPRRAFTKEDNDKFYQSHWRYFQTNDKQFDHPTPIQGQWKIDGIALDQDVLQKFYWDNAYNFYNLERFNVS
ncbi:amidohydrolase family protein [candidate division KSB1 bacterium]|nr:amidohydrolase family protein [candidate division KSB1 bacterium]